MTRSYSTTHSWLSFRARLDGASPRLWMLLGECQSKCEHVAHTPLRPATAKELHQIYLAKGVLATTAIDGNTLSEEEVLRHIQHGLVLPRSQAYLTREIDNIVEGCHHIGDAILQGRAPVVTPESIARLNRTVLRGIRLEEGVVPGELRTHSVVVGRYCGAPAEDLPFLVDTLCEWLNGEEFAATEGLRIVYAVLKAVIAHLYLAWIHPFGDGDGRTARLLEFQILLSAGVPSPSAHLLSNFYNWTRTEYYRQSGRASESGGAILPFVEYAVTGFCDELRLQIDKIWEQQWDVAWRTKVNPVSLDTNLG